MAATSTSVTFFSVPATSTSFDTNVPTAPTGFPELAATDVNAGLLFLSSTGASLTAATFSDAVSVAAENVVAPPLEAVVSKLPFAPNVRSQARNVIAVGTSPLKLAVGLK